jgi:hypothetical protein
VGCCCMMDPASFKGMCTWGKPAAPAPAAAPAAATVPLQLAGADYPGYGLCSYHYATLELGTPPQRFNAIIDTGSTITYVPCNGCMRCGPNHWVRTPCKPCQASAASDRRPQHSCSTTCPVQQCRQTQPVKSSPEKQVQPNLFLQSATAWPTPHLYQGIAEPSPDAFADAVHCRTLLSTPTSPTPAVMWGVQQTSATRRPPSPAGQTSATTTWAMVRGTGQQQQQQQQQQQHATTSMFN